VVDASGLLGAVSRDVGYDIRHALNRGTDLGERLAGKVDQLDAFLDLIFRIDDEVFDVFRSLRRTLRKAPHLRGDHRKATAGFTGARGFDRGIQCEQIGLPGDLVDALMMSAILLEESSIRDMASTARVTTSPLRIALSQVLPTSLLACWEWSEFTLTFFEISSIEAVVSSRLVACSSIRCDK
jgi:hypothetical protein